MSARTTVMFADLTGSTGVFEALGNEAATQTITGLTHWIGQTCQRHRGRVVKTLGDGVLALFPDGENALDAAVHLQREHARRQKAPGPARLMDIQIGLDSGEIVEVDGDCYGDAVNVASRMADLSGGRQIWGTDSVTEQVEFPAPGVRFHSLGSVAIRGKAQQRKVFRIEWEDTATDMMTLPGLAAPALEPARPQRLGMIQLRHLDVSREFQADQLPVHMGRSREAEFVVNERTVSRLHARIEWRNGSFVLVDLSSFGTAVRFTGAKTVLTLRRDECVLHDSGEIALAANFEDLMVPTVNFALLLTPAGRR